MIIFKITICFMMMMIIGAALTEDRSDSLDPAFNVEGKILRTLFRAKRERGCVDCKIPYSAKIQAIEQEKIIKENANSNNRNKREPRPSQCGPKYPDSPPGTGPCYPPTPQTGLPLQTFE